MECDASKPSTRHTRDTDWLRTARWGVFQHFLTEAATSVDEWNRRVDGFDVEALAAQLAEVGAGYCFITLGQGSGHYCAPNDTYDELTGIRPSKCSQRDLVADQGPRLAGSSPGTCRSTRTAPSPSRSCGSLARSGRVATSAMGIAQGMENHIKWKMGTRCAT